MSSARPWLKGLKFSCVECGKCCKGSRTNVYVNPAEIGAMAKHIGLEDSEFARRYTEDRELGEEIGTSLRNLGGACAMLGDDRKTCRVHDVKPTQCKTYPYWAPLLVSEANLHAEAQRCPGIGEGGIVDEKTILRNMVVNQIHERGIGENWVYEEAIDLIKDAEMAQPGMLDDFADEFYSVNTSQIVCESDNIRVVDSVVSGQETSRRLEFKSSLSMTQSEVYLREDGSVDHSQLALPIHKFMASVVHAVVGNGGDARIAMIGGGACVLPSHLLHSSEKCLLIDVIEPLGEVSEVAKKLFAAKFDASGDLGGMALHEMTGQEYLRRSEVPALDLLLIDAMDSLPLQVFTKYEADEDHPEYIAPPTALLEEPANLFKHLRPDGFLVINLLGPHEYIVAVHSILKEEVNRRGNFNHLFFSFPSSPNAILVITSPEAGQDEALKIEKLKVIANKVLCSNSMDRGAEAFLLNEHGEKVLFTFD